MMGPATARCVPLTFMLWILAGPMANASETPEKRAIPSTCTYSSYHWNVKTKRAANRKKVSKPYADLNADERDPIDPQCTVCEEDQRTVPIPGTDHTVRVCWKYAERVEAAMTRIVKSGTFQFSKIKGYRPGKTRGAVKNSLRQQWSNHSFGTAIDINSNHNGLYRGCKLAPDQLTGERVRKKCRLGVGGKWDPTVRPKKTITRESIVYKAFTQDVKWGWGGELEGRMKDFMHFSLDGGR